MTKRQKIGFIIAGSLAVISWIIAITYWGRLPDVIPIHFGINGMADDWANKSIFYVFLLPSLQTIITGLMLFLYYKPQYSDMPTTLWLVTLDKPHQNKAFGLIRHMLIGTAIWVGILLTYMTYGMNQSAIDTKYGMSPIIMFSILGAMIVWLTIWSVRCMKNIKSVMKDKKSK